MNLKETMICSGCRKKVDMDSTMTCVTSHFELNDYMIYNFSGCPDYLFYCPDCLNKLGFCKYCSSHIDIKTQEEISNNWK